MADIRVRTGRTGKTYQLRFEDPAAEGGYAYKTFKTRKDALAYRDSGATQALRSAAPPIKTVKQGLEKWLDVCEKEGRNGRDPSPRTRSRTTSGGATPFSSTVGQNPCMN